MVDLPNDDPQIPSVLVRDRVAAALKILGCTDERITSVLVEGEKVEFTFPITESEREEDFFDQIAPPDRFLTYVVPIINE